MEEIPISKFKATCLAVLERVRRTGTPIRVTRFGRPVAEVVPPQSPDSGRAPLGSLRGKLEVTGDLLAPVAGPEDWEVFQDEAVARHARVDLESQRAGAASSPTARRPRKPR